VSATVGASAPARIGLAGNPSDGYGGATLSLAIRNYAATVELRPSAVLAVEPDSALVRAAMERFARRFGVPSQRVAARWTTTVPREVGLGGSSAIVIATLRALCALHDLELPADRLATLALAVETEDLGIAAGPQDRFAQAHGGLTLMKFAAPEVRVESLDPALLPPLVLAHSHAASSGSGTVHAGLRERYESGAPDVAAAMRHLAALAQAARDALLSGERESFAACVDATFEARRRLVELDARQAALVDVARAAGAACNYAGSGGAVVAVCRDGPEDVIRAFERAGCAAVVPLPAR
jgi:glucuronokinase